MEQYASFTFEAVTINRNAGKVFLDYKLGDRLLMRETLTFPTDFPMHPEMDTVALSRALHALHLAGGVSYYKTCLPKKILLKTEPLTSFQAQFWNSLYEEGLGEFFYKNKVDFRSLIQFPSTQTASITNNLTAQSSSLIAHRSPRLLVPIGGGKDSVVTAELLKKAGYDVTLFRMGSHPLIERLAKEMDLPLLTVGRSLSPILFELNAQGALNGHVPITGYLSAVAATAAVLYDFDAVVLSNERSASIGNVEYLGKEINHQWSKSMTFEKAFQEYMAMYITPNIQYFSLIRPLSELKVTQLFTQYPQYLPLTTSCNKNWKIAAASLPSSSCPPSPTGEGGTTLRASGASSRYFPSPRGGGVRGEGKDEGGIKGGGNLWCGQCPKCAFVFALLAAFVDPKTLEKTFGKNLFADASLLPLYRELLGTEGFKPFECVGTPEETRAAFLLAQKHTSYAATPIMKMFTDEVLPSIKDPDALIEETLQPSAEHAIPEPFLKALTADR